MFFLGEKIRYVLGYVPNNVQEMPPKQTIRRGWNGKGSENSQEDTSRRDHAVNCRLKLARWRILMSRSYSEDELEIT